MALCNNLLADSPHQAHFCAKSAHIRESIGCEFFGSSQESFLAISRSGGRRLQEREREAAAAVRRRSARSCCARSTCGRARPEARWPHSISFPRFFFPLTGWRQPQGQQHFAALLRLLALAPRMINGRPAAFLFVSTHAHIYIQQNNSGDQQKGLRPQGELVGRLGARSSGSGRATFYWLGVN
jgi:hypothetical protein